MGPRRDGPRGGPGAGRADPGPPRPRVVPSREGGPPVGLGLHGRGLERRRPPAGAFPVLPRRRARGGSRPRGRPRDGLPRLRRPPGPPLVRRGGGDGGGTVVGGAGQRPRSDRDPLGREDPPSWSRRALPRGPRRGRARVRPLGSARPGPPRALRPRAPPRPLSACLARGELRRGAARGHGDDPPRRRALLLLEAGDVGALVRGPLERRRPLARDLAPRDRGRRPSQEVSGLGILGNPGGFPNIPRPDTVNKSGRTQ